MNVKRKTKKPYARRFISFPIFVPGKEGEPSDVPGNFLRRPDGAQGVWSTPWVHPVSDSDLNFATMVRFLKPADRDLICGALELGSGMRQRDRQILRGAYKKLTPVLLGWADVSESLLDFFAGAPWAIHYAQAVSEAMTNARPVLWWNGKRNKYQLAFFCEDWKAALFLSLYLEHMRQCPCGQLFVPPKGNVWYCKPQHSAYYRLKRWRHKQRKKPGQ
jgi:hypothetical protein